MRDPQITHKIMSAIKSKNTRPELALRHELWKRGLRYRVNDKKLRGKPDIVFSRARLVVFCDGDYWHGHNWALRGLRSLEDELEGYSEYWRAKIRYNVERDMKNNQELRDSGWEVMRVWESDIKKDVGKCAERVEAAYRERLQSPRKHD